MRSMGMAAALCLLPVGAFAQGAAPTALSVATEQDFYACDGNGAPGLKYDGRQKGVWFWADTNFQDRQAATAVTACDKALAEPMLADRYWLRRAALNRAKALHQLALRDYAAALPSLDKSDAALQRPAVIGYEDPARAGNQMLRAVAFYGLGRKEEARAALAAILSARPWAASLRDAVMMIRMSFEPDYATQKAQMREGALTDAGRVRALFWLSMVKYDFADALLYGRQISFDAPRGRRGWTSYADDVRHLEVIRDQAFVAGATAYALAATGDAQGSQREYQRALAELDDAAAPPVSEDGRPPSKAAMRDFDLRKAAATEAREQLQDWDRAIRTRGEAPKLTLDELAKYPDRPRQDGSAMAGDFVRLAKPDTMQPNLPILLANSLAERLERDRVKALTVSLPKVASRIPQIPDGTSIPLMRGEGGNLWRTDLSGFAVRKADDPDLVNIRFGDVEASSATVEEAAFLAAANYVQSQGKDGFVVEANQLIQRTVTTSGLYVRTSSTPSGYELRLLIRPISIAAMPAGDPLRWRVIKAADVQVALGKKFAPPQAPAR